MHAMRDRERKHLHCGRKGCHGWLINKIAFLCLELGRGDADELVVVGKYTQTRQRWLKDKIVKSNHSRHYKKIFTVPRIGVKKTREEHERKNRIERN